MECDVGYAYRGLSPPSVSDLLRVEGAILHESRSVRHVVTAFDCQLPRRFSAGSIEQHDSTAYTEVIGAVTAMTTSWHGTGG